MRISTLDERNEFYSNEFDIVGLTRWIGKRKRQMKFAMILGRHTGIVMPERKADKNNVVIIDSWQAASDLKEYALDYLPEAIYYDRNRYHNISDCSRCGDSRRRCPSCYNFNGQQLAFDLDPENVDCPYHGHIGEKMASGRGLSFCMYEFKAVRRQAYHLYAEMQESFDRVGIVYSGRGFHVVVDDEAAYELSRAQRASLARDVAARFDIDEWVTIGDSRLMRLPFSLNGLVSRRCVLIKWGKDLLKFDPRTSRAVIPRFLKSF